MPLNKVEQKNIEDILCDELGVDARELAPEARLEEDLGMVEYDWDDLAIRLEDEFELADEITEESQAAMKTVGDIHTYIEKAKRG